MNNKKVLILKHGSIGDIFMAFSSITSIIEFYENITICSTKSGFKTLDLLNKSFEKIEDNRSKNILTNIKIIRKLLKENFDVVIDLQNSNRTSFYLFIFKVFSNAITNGTSRFASLVYRKINNNEHAIHGLENQISLLNIPVQKTKINPNRKILKQIVFVPGSSVSGKQKRWPIENYIKVMNFLSNKNITSIVIGGKEEEDLFDKIPKDNKFIINLIGNSPWLEVKKIALSSMMAITNDTSAMHLISNLNIPIIAIMNDNNYADRNYPLSDKSIVVKSDNIKKISTERLINEISKFIE